MSHGTQASPPSSCGKVHEQDLKSWGGGFIITAIPKNFTEKADIHVQRGEGLVANA